MEGASLEFTPDALREVAREALKKDTGARAVRSVVESFMLELLYDLPGKARGNRFTVTPEVVRGEAAPAIEAIPPGARAEGDRGEKVRSLDEADGRRESA
jgi:ATP-dependent protease Clp ATPase subunit